MIDAVVALYVLLFVSTAFLALIYFYRLRQGARESLDAKKALDDIIISFNKDLESGGRKIRELEERQDKKLSELSRSLSHFESQIQAIENRIGNVQQVMNGLINDYKAQRGSLEHPPTYQAKNRESHTANGHLSSQNIATETLTMPPIPLRKESALAPLTDTELQILRLLANEGGKTSPEIKERIGLTREHTARLMKKLYAHGYVERRTEKTPYVYRIKKEMEGLLNTPSPST